MRTISTLEHLKKLLSGNMTFHLYGAGFQTVNLLQNLQICGIHANFQNILVSNAAGNPEQINHIPVIQCDKDALNENDCILLTVSDHIKNIIADNLKDCKADLIDPQPAFYDDVYHSIKPFADVFPHKVSGLNRPTFKPCGRIIWSCWWQGEENAPDIVKACWKSQQKKLRNEIRHIIITKDNFFNYIFIPDFVLDKFNGESNLAHLADFIRVCLLYKYGGVWLDSTVLLLDELPDECWTLPLYTWNFNASHFCSKAIWTTFFLAGQRGNTLYQFLMEAFLYYFTHYDKIKYYCTIDYFIAICSNNVDGVLEQFRKIPYNNQNAMSLCKHLNEPYSENNLQKYCQNSFIQKLSWHNNKYDENSIFSYILKKELLGNN